MVSKEGLSIIHNEEGQPVGLRFDQPQRLNPGSWREILKHQITSPPGVREIEIWKGESDRPVSLANDLRCLRQQFGRNRRLHLDILVGCLRAGQVVVIRDTTQGEANSRPKVRSAVVEKPDLRRATIILNNAIKNPNIRILLARPGKEGKVSCKVRNPHQEFGRSADQRKMTALVKKMGKSIVIINEIPIDSVPRRTAIEGELTEDQADDLCQTAAKNPDLTIVLYEVEPDGNGAGAKIVRTAVENPYFLKLSGGEGELEDLRRKLQQADIIVLEENPSVDE